MSWRWVGGVVLGYLAWVAVIVAACQVLYDEPLRPTASTRTAAGGRSAGPMQATLRGANSSGPIRSTAAYAPDSNEGVDTNVGIPTGSVAHAILLDATNDMNGIKAGGRVALFLRSNKSDLREVLTDLLVLKVSRNVDGQGQSEITLALKGEEIAQVQGFAPYGNFVAMPTGGHTPLKGARADR